MNFPERISKNDNKNHRYYFLASEFLLQKRYQEGKLIIPRATQQILKIPLAERAAYLKSLISIIKAEGEIKPEEFDILKDLYRRFGSTKDALISDIKEFEDKQNLTSVLNQQTPKPTISQQITSPEDITISEKAENKHTLESVPDQEQVEDSKKECKEAFTAIPEQKEQENDNNAVFVCCPNCYSVNRITSKPLGKKVICGECEESLQGLEEYSYDEIWIKREELKRQLEAEEKALKQKNEEAYQQAEQSKSHELKSPQVHDDEVSTAEIIIEGDKAKTSGVPIPPRTATAEKPTVAKSLQEILSRVQQTTESDTRKRKTKSASLKSKKSQPSIFFSDDEDEIKYEGEFDNYLTGIGIKTYPGGTKFEGEFKSGSLIKGTKIFPNGSKYEGEFRANNLNGIGIKTCADGKIFSGKFKDGELVKGSISYTDGKKLEGEFKNGSLIKNPNPSLLPKAYPDESKIIKSTKRFSDGHKEEGEFNNGSLIKGIITFHNGEIWDGEFVNNALIKGKKILSKDHIEDGEFLNGDLHKGRVTYSDKSVEEGIFHEGFLTSGSRYLSSQIIFKGRFESNMLIEGTVFFSDGTKYEALINEQGFIVHGKSILPNGHSEEIKYIEGDSYISGVNISYDGTRQNGVFDKDGIMKEGEKLLPNGEALKGRFNKGELKEGNIKTANGEIQEGKFIDNLLIKGKRVLSSGLVYEGSFRNNNIYKGKKTYPSGESEEGDFKNGLLVKGRKTYANGDVYDGIFFQGDFIKGIRYISGKSTEQGIFHRENLIEGKKTKILNGTTIQLIYKNGRKIYKDNTKEASEVSISEASSSESRGLPIPPREHSKSKKPETKIDIDFELVARLYDEKSDYEQMELNEETNSNADHSETDLEENISFAQSDEERWKIFGSKLLPYQIDLLKVLIENENSMPEINRIAKGNRTMPGILIDSVNETAFDYIDDTIIIYNEKNLPIIVTEYLEYIKTIVYSNNQIRGE